MAEKRLSELIREGAKLRPQAFGSYFLGRGANRFSCALGAAAEALTKRAHFASIATLEKKYGDVLQLSFHCLLPGCSRVAPMKLLITHLNDEHSLSREGIAEHVKSLGY